MSQRLRPAMFEKYRGLQLPLWIVLLPEEAEIRRDPAIMIRFDKTGIKVRRITEFRQSALRSGV